MEFEQWTAKARDVPIEREIERRGIKLKRVGVEHVGPCPKCGGDDRFAVNVSKQIFNCRGCGVGGDVIELVQHLDGVGFIGACAKLTGEPPPKANGKTWTTVSEHVYHDEHGKPFLKVKKCRDADGKKQYPQFHWDGAAWIKGKPKGAKIPYRLPKLLASPTTTTVYLCEGEKDADSLAKLGFVATTASEGAAAKWDPALTKYFKDRRVVILPDADEPGRQHARKVAKAINGAAASVKVVDLYPDRANGHDVSNWIKNDRAGVKLLEQIKQTPLWEDKVDDVRSDDAKADSADDDTAAPKKQADILIALADEAHLIHTPASDAYADVKVADHRETYRVRSKSFRSWLAHAFYKAQNGAPNSEAMQAALGVFEARALFDGPEIAVHVRVAGNNGKLYLDLANWRVISSPPVRFRRAPGMLPLPEPVRGGSIEALRPLLNVRDDADFCLIVAWLLAALRDVGPFPVLVLSGEHGAAKSMLCGLLRALIDPNTAPLRALPREDRDLFIAASNGRLLSFDNVSGLPAWLSDTLCRLATGGGFSVRQLYTDDDEKLFDAMRPAILNGIEDVVTRSDLVDRSIVLTLEPISEVKRQPEGALWAEFDKARPRILGALLDAIVSGLRELPHVRLEQLPRMADFATWITACEPALWQAGTFAAAYSANRQTGINAVLEADLVASAVIKLVADVESWMGTASALLPILAENVPEPQRRIKKAWPALPHLLSGRLRRAAPNLRKIGIEITSDRDNHERTIEIKRLPDWVGKRASPASPASPVNDLNRLAVTLPDRSASPAASPPAADDAGDAPGDADSGVSVTTKSLKIQHGDAGDAGDAEIHTQSACCAHCGEPLDGTEPDYWIGGEQVRLHRGCERSYQADEDAP